MKKVISLFAALAMVLTLFTSVAFAEVPSSATLHLDINPADEDQIEEYMDTVELSSIPAGYTLYVVGISQSGLGAFTNSNTKTTATQLKRPTGFLPIGMTFLIDFDAENFAHIYNEDDKGETYFLVVGNKFKFKSTFSSEDRTIGAYITTYENNGDEYPLNASGKSSIAENETIVELYILVNAATVGTLNEGTLFNMAQMSGGANQPISGTNVTSNQAKYSIGNKFLTCTDAFELGSAAPVTPTYTIAFQDWDGSSLGSDTYDEGATVTAPTASRTGYTHTGWSPAFSATAAADVTYTAQYSPIKVSSITLDKASLSLKIGGTGNVAVSSVLPSDALDKTYTWSSTNTSVATVSGGTVTAVGIGTATIKATANDGSGKYGECTVTVTKEPVTGITITGSANATVGDNVQLSATVAPSNATYKTVTWSKVSGSGDVSSTGVVTATAAGAVTARATADGVTKDFTVTFAPKTYTVAFKTYDGASDIQSSTYNEGASVSVPEKASAPARDGYVFAGWAEKANAALSERVTPATTATATKTYYAVYVQIPTDTAAKDTALAANKGAALTKIDSTSAGTADADYYGGKVDFTANTEFFGYQVVLRGHKIGSSEIEEKVCDPLTIGAGKNIELSGSAASFTVLVKTTTRVITEILIRAFEK